MKNIVILGGGMGGYYTARGLEDSLQPGEANVTLVDMHSYLMYQPFLAEVAGGAIEPRHIQVPLAQHLPRTRVVRGKVAGIDHAQKLVKLQSESGNERSLEYDMLVVALGGVTRTFPIPGLADFGVGLKSTQEAAWIRDTFIKHIEEAASLPKGSRNRDRLLTFAVVGGGLSGTECFAEVVTMARDLVAKTKGVYPHELNMYLIEVMDKIMPEVPKERSQWVIELMRKKGAHVLLNTSIEDASDGLLHLSNGDVIDCGLLVWTAGQIANPILKKTDLPLDERGRLNCNEYLCVTDTDGNLVPDAWGLGDCCKTPDLSGDGLPDGSCAPTAQHAVRQARVLSKNLVHALRGEPLEQYFHANAGMVAGLGTGNGLFASGDKKIIVTGLPAWLAHRGYHGLALPTWERKLRVFADWTEGLFLGRDTTSVDDAEDPRGLFREFAARP
jgi:NADH dehydrogenase